ncbi:MAG: hypothetical protein PHQ12_04895 [Chthoniobacteraceae bacterium]|nr:hypothetical protein [Chthoniobacteraceae bacterium]
MSDFKELELEIDDLTEEPIEEQLRTLLRQINGVHTARITQSGVHVIYNPLGITPEELVQTVRKAGFTVDYTQKA